MIFRFSALAVSIVLILLCAACNVEQPESRETAYPSLTPIKLNGKCGYLNDEGELVIEPRFDAAYDFTEGLALVSIDNMQGVIDAQGRMLVGPKFTGSLVTGFRQGLATVAYEYKWGVIDRKGNWVVEPKYEYVIGPFDDRGLARMLVNYGKSAVVFNKRGEIQTCEPADELNEELYKGGQGFFSACFLKGGGLEVTSVEFDQAFYFHDRELGLHCAKANNELYGLLNEKGEWAVEPGFAAIRPFSRGLAPALQPGGGWGFIDPAGEWVVQPKFGSLVPLESSGLAQAQAVHTELWGLVDKQGEWVVEPSFNLMEPFRNGLALVRDQEGKYGFIDDQGRLAIPPRFDWVDPWSNPFAGHDLAVAAIDVTEAVDRRVKLPDGNMGNAGDVKIKGNFGIIDRAGNWVLPPEYASIDEFPEQGGCTTGRDKQGRTVIINAKGRVVLFLERENGRKALKDPAGNLVWPLSEAN